MKTDTLKKMLLMLLCVVSVNMTALGKELVSDVLPIADPYILFYNDTYYAYGTSRADGFEVYSSKDMKSWERSPRLALSKEDSYGDKWFWAPEVYYVEEDKDWLRVCLPQRSACRSRHAVARQLRLPARRPPRPREIGRASCRERV